MCFVWKDTIGYLQKVFIDVLSCRNSKCLPKVQIGLFIFLNRDFVTKRIQIIRMQSEGNPTAMVLVKFALKLLVISHDHGENH